MHARCPCSHDNIYKCNYMVEQLIKGLSEALVPMTTFNYMVKQLTKLLVRGPCPHDNIQLHFINGKTVNKNACQRPLFP